MAVTTDPGSGRVTELNLPHNIPSPVEPWWFAAELDFFCDLGQFDEFD